MLMTNCGVSTMRWRFGQMIMIGTFAQEYFTKKLLGSNEMIHLVMQINQSHFCSSQMWLVGGSDWVKHVVIPVEIADDFTLKIELRGLGTLYIVVKFSRTLSRPMWHASCPNMQRCFIWMEWRWTRRLMIHQYRRCCLKRDHPAFDVENATSAPLTF